MNNKHYVGRRAKSIILGVELPSVSRIVLTGRDDTIYVSGNNSGYTMEVYVPDATQQMADDLLLKAKGFVYQGYSANNAFILPEAELGDGITVNGIYSMLASRDYNFTPKLTENISAPYSQEGDHEYQYTGDYEQELQKRIEQGKKYKGVSISPDLGFSVGNMVNFYDGGINFFTPTGGLGLYLDYDLGMYKTTGLFDIEDSLDSSETVRYLKTEVKDAQNNILQVQQDASSMMSEIRDAQGNISTLQQTAYMLSSDIRDAEGNISSLQQTARSLTSLIQDAEGNISTLQQTAKSLRSDISSVEGDVSSLEQTAKSLTSQISDAKGNISTLQQTAKSLSSQIVSVEGDVSSLEQTAKSLRSDISSMSGDISSISQYAHSITLSVSNSAASSTITLKAGSTQISSQKIEFTGMVSFADLKGSGTTEINGANIKTGTISADRIDATKLKVQKVYAPDGINLMLYETSSGKVSLGFVSKETLVNGSKVTVGTAGNSTYIYGSSVTVGTSGNKVGFFGSSGNSKQTVSTVSTGTSVTASTVATGLNNLINALKKYNLV